MRYDAYYVRWICGREWCDGVHTIESPRTDRARAPSPPIGRVLLDLNESDQRETVLESDDTGADSIKGRPTK